MTVLEILKLIALLGTIAVGAPALIKPESILGFTGIASETARAKSEVRAIFGGLLIGLGLAPLILGSAAAYQVVGVAYLAIALARAVSILVDRSFEASNLISLGVEIVFSAILVV